MQNVVSTYYIIQPGGRSKMLALEGDNPQNDQAALELFEQYTKRKSNSIWRHSKKQKFVRLEKTVSAEMVSIPLQPVEEERKTFDVHGPNPDEMIREVYDMIDLDMAEDLITIAKETLEI